MMKTSNIPTHWDAARLREYIKRHQVTQAEVAMALGVDLRTLSRWAAGYVPVPGPVRACLDSWELHEQTLEAARMGQRW